MILSLPVRIPLYPTGFPVEQELIRVLKKIVPVLILLSGLLFFQSCRSENKVLENEDLFVIPMGLMADELDYFYRSNSQLPGYSDLFVRDGRVYLSSSHAGKIMEMNSYGDLLGLYYNPRINPEPAEYTSRDETESLIRIRKWNFRNIEHMAVTDSRMLVVDQVEDSLSHIEDRILYNRIILRFDSEGNYQDYLGQEGINGTPFSYIQDLEVTSRGDIFVVTRSIDDTIVYWFAEDGQLLYKVILDRAHLPSLDQPGWTAGEPGGIRPDPLEHKLYIKLDYFPQNDTPDQSAVSRLYTLDLDKETYTEFFEIPRLTITLNEQEIEGVYEYLGSTTSGMHFFLGSDFNGRYSLRILDREGAVKVSRILYVRDREIIYKKFHLSPEGLLAGIFYEEKGARVSWWRADRIVEKYADS